MQFKAGILDGKIALVTGCNRGIGATILDRFAREGAIVYANSRTSGSLDRISEELNDIYPGKVLPVYFDIRDTSDIRAVFGRIQKEKKRLDILVNNAGIMKDALIGMVTRELMRELFETNVFASIELLQYAARIMKKQRSGSIINFSSIVGVSGNSGQIAYASSKGAIISMTKTAAKELSSFNIRVNAVAPGMIETDMFRSIGETRMREHLKRIGMGRFGKPEDVADVCVMLASDYTKYVTGQVLGVDGATVI